MAELNRTGLLNDLQQVPSRAASEAELGYVHPAAHVELVRRVSAAGGGFLDPDTYTNRFTFEAATVAAGRLNDLTLAAGAGRVGGGFARARPPGHHATADRSMGFCLFSNLALAARAALRDGGAGRVAIVDFDVHHGNGTEAICAADPDILFVSTHQYPNYPGTGRLAESGAGTAAGTTLNIPLPSGVGDEGFRAIYEEVVLPAVRRFAPDLILVSAGFDAHWADPLAGLGLSLAGFAWMCRTLVELAAEVAAGRIVFTLEGGYDLEVLSAGVANTIRALLGRDDFADPLGESSVPEPDLAGLLARVKKLHGIS